MVTMASSVASNVGATPLSPDVSTTTIQKKSSENRRSNKPIMEKRRRARINHSLNELKTLILDAMKKDPARHSKLEKADILEMTVKHLESLHKQQAAMSTLTDKYRAGFSECASEVNRFPGLEPHVRKRLLQHLNNCLNTASVTSLPTNDLSNRVGVHNLQVHIVPSDNGAVNTPNGIYLSTGGNSGLQVLPTRLANGDLALIVPSTSVSNIQQRLSVSPTPSSSSSSPPPLAMINHHHARSASADSTASSNSPIGFERLSVNVPASSSSIDDMCHSPGSVHSNYSSPHSPGAASNQYENYGRYSPQKPLSLVVREDYVDSDDKPWRPW